MAPHYHSPNVFLSAFPVFTSQDHLEKQNKNLTVSSRASTVAAGNIPPRCARRCTDVLSTQETLNCCFWTSQQVFCSTQDVTLHRLAYAHCVQREIPISFSTIWIWP